MDENYINIFIGRKIREIRVQKGITQQMLADACDMEIPNLSRIENGRTNPTVRTLFKLCQALDFPMQELFRF